MNAGPHFLAYRNLKFGSVFLAQWNLRSKIFTCAWPGDLLRHIRYLTYLPAQPRRVKDHSTCIGKASSFNDESSGTSTFHSSGGDLCNSGKNQGAFSSSGQARYEPKRR